jgi:hypothetical protein
MQCLIFPQSVIALCKYLYGLHPFVMRSPAVVTEYSDVTDDAVAEESAVTSHVEGCVECVVLKGTVKSCWFEDDYTC